MLQNLKPPTSIPLFFSQTFPTAREQGNDKTLCCLEVSQSVSQSVSHTTYCLLRTRFSLFACKHYCSSQRPKNQGLSANDPFFKREAKTLDEKEDRPRHKISALPSQPHNLISNDHEHPTNPASTSRISCRRNICAAAVRHTERRITFRPFRPSPHFGRSDPRSLTKQAFHPQQTPRPHIKTVQERRRFLQKAPLRPISLPCTSPTLCKSFS